MDSLNWNSSNIYKSAWDKLMELVTRMNSAFCNIIMELTLHDNYCVRFVIRSEESYKA
jgi:hypothetical protein